MKRFYTALFSILFIPIIGLAATAELESTPPGTLLKPAGPAAQSLSAGDDARKKRVRQEIERTRQSVLGGRWDEMNFQDAVASPHTPISGDDGIRANSYFNRSAQPTARLFCTSAENDTDLGNKRTYAIQGQGKQGKWITIGQIQTAVNGQSLDILDLSIQDKYRGKKRGKEAVLTVFDMYKHNRQLPFTEYRLEVPFPETANKTAFYLYTGLGFKIDPDATQSMKDAVKSTGEHPECYRHLVVMHLPRTEAEALASQI